MIKTSGWMAALAAAGLIALSAGAFAADIPIKAPPKAVMQESSGGFYLWVDGSYQNIHLPTYDLGTRLLPAPTFFDRGPLETYDPRAEGWGIAGAVGYVLPYGTLPAMFGANAMIEVGGSYVSADDTQSGASSLIAGTDGSFLQMLNGVVQSATLCGFVAGCGTTSTLATAYKSWAVNAKGASDYKTGALTLTPSVQLFGGRTSNDQDLAQTFSNLTPPGSQLYTYSAHSALRWTDVGAKFGLDARVDVTSWLQLGVGGTIGTAHRHASLAANDLCANGPALCTGFGLPTATSIDAGTNATPLLANAEASALVRLTPAVTIRGFGGLNYDSRVPGISAPTFSNAAVPAAGNTGGAAGIKFESETSWYAGGGLVIKFVP